MPVTRWRQAGPPLNAEGIHSKQGIARCQAEDRTAINRSVLCRVLDRRQQVRELPAKSWLRPGWQGLGELAVAGLS